MGRIVDPEVDEVVEPADDRETDDRAPQQVGALPPPPPPPPPPPDSSELLDAPVRRASTPASDLTPPPLPEASALPLASAAPSSPVTASSELVTEDRPSAPSRSAPGFVRTGHPVRDRLLAKAAEARAAEAPTLGPSPGERGPSQRDALPGFSSLETVGRELDEIAAPRVGEGPGLRIGGAPLSSTNLLLFGTVSGLALVASLFTLLIKLAPQPGPGISLAPAPVPAVPVAPLGVQPATAPPAEALAPSPRKKIAGPWRIGSAGPGQKRITGSIGREPFLKAIQTAGIDKSEAYRVYTALKDQKNLDRCAPKDEFVALLEGGRVVAFEYVVSREEVYQARQGDDGLLRGKQLDLKVERHRVQGALSFDGRSFAEVARAARFEPALQASLNKALEGHTSVAQFKRGDRLRVVAQEVTVLGEFARYAGLEAIEYLPASGDPLRIYYFNARKRYYDAKGRAPGEGGWRRPVKDAPITSKFNPQRMHPILKKRMPHNGTDFGAPTGTPIYAASYGTISTLGNYGANGNYIAITHDNGYETGYSHLSRFEPGLSVGSKVQRMQVIGYVGSTGRSTGPHLHFSAKKNGAFIDPETLNLDALTVLPAEDRANFAKVRAQYDELLEAVALPPALPQTVASIAAAAPLPSEHDEAEMMLDPGSPDPMELAAPIAPAAPTIAAAAPQPPVSQAPTAHVPAPAITAVHPVQIAPPGQPYRSLYLSDKELMQSQSASDEDEVEE